MITALLGRAVQYTLVLAVVLSINFVLPRLAPGDPVEYLLGDQTVQLTAEQRAQVLEQFGLDQPVTAQFRSYLGGLARGDLGVSIQFRRPVSDVLAERLPWTVGLVASGLLLASVIGTAVGLLAAWHRGSRLDGVSMAVAVGLYAMPAFWLGMLLLGVFAIQLGWLPSLGTPPAGIESGWPFVLEVLRRSLLPVLTVALGTLGAIALVTRSAVIATLGEDYLRSAEAHGLSAWRIALVHALRNALVPIATVVLLYFGSMLGGAVVIEAVFSYPGLGQLVYDSVLARDYPLLQGAFLLIAAGVILANLLADLLYPLLDPRIRRPMHGL